MAQKLSWQLEIEGLPKSIAGIKELNRELTILSRHRFGNLNFSGLRAIAGSGGAAGGGNNTLLSLLAGGVAGGLPDLGRTSRLSALLLHRKQQNLDRVERLLKVLRAQKAASNWPLGSQGAGSGLGGSTGIDHGINSFSSIVKGFQGKPGNTMDLIKGANIFHGGKIPNVPSYDLNANDATKSALWTLAVNKHFHGETAAFQKANHHMNQFNDPFWFKEGPLNQADFGGTMPGFHMNSWLKKDKSRSSGIPPDKFSENIEKIQAWTAYLKSKLPLSYPPTPPGPLGSHGSGNPVAQWFGFHGKAVPPPLPGAGTGGGGGGINIRTLLSAGGFFGGGFGRIFRQIGKGAFVVAALIAAFELLRYTLHLFTDGIKRGFDAYTSGARTGRPVGKAFELRSMFEALGLSGEEGEQLLLRGQFGNKSTRRFDVGGEVIGAARAHQLGSAQMLTNIGPERIGKLMAQSAVDAKAMEQSAGALFETQVRMNIMTREWHTMWAQVATIFAPLIITAVKIITLGLQLINAALIGAIKILKEGGPLLNLAIFGPMMGMMVTLLGRIPGPPGSQQIAGGANAHSATSGWEKIGFVFGASSTNDRMRQVAQNTKDTVSELKKLNKNDQGSYWRGQFSPGYSIP